MSERTLIFKRLGTWWRANWKHPAMVLPAMIVLTQIVKEFYPFSHFPMYSNPNSQPATVVFAVDADLRDEDGSFVPVSMERVFGVRAASIKKRLYSEFRKRADQLDLKNRRYMARDLPKEDVERFASELLDYLRRQAEKNGNRDKLPPRLALVHREIYAEIGVKLRRNEWIMAEEGEEDP